MSIDKPLVMGHRGAMATVAENTLASMQAAIDAGCDVIELDVHALEGELIVFHDHRLERLTGQSGRIGDLTLAQLKAHKVDGHAIPTLREVAKLCKGLVALNVELKGQGCVEPMVAMYNEMIDAGWTAEDIIISSFDHLQMAQFKARVPGARFGYLVVGQPMDLAAGAQAFGAYALHVCYEFITPAFVADAKARQLQVYVYTVNYEQDMVELLDMGVDGIMTDYPDVLYRVVNERVESKRAVTLSDNVIASQAAPAAQSALVDV